MLNIEKRWMALAITATLVAIPAMGLAEEKRSTEDDAEEAASTNEEIALEDDSKAEADELPRVGIETITVLGLGADGGTLGGQDLKELPMASMVVNRKEIDRIKFVDPDEFLDRIPGETQVRNLRIPQGGKSYTVPLVDGLPLANPYNGATQDITDVNSFDIERIEIIKGPASALYPSNAFGGTINVITRNPPAEPEVRVWTEGGEFSRFRAGLHAAGTVGNVGYFLDGNTQSAEGLRDTYQNDREQLSGKVIFQPNDRTRFTVRGEYIERDEVFPGDLSQSEFDEDLTQVGGTVGSEEDIESVQLSLHLQRDLTDASDLEVSFVRRNEDSIGIGRFSGPNQTELDDATAKIMYGHDFEHGDSRLVLGAERFDGEVDFLGFAVDDAGDLTNEVLESTLGGIEINSLFGQFSFTPVSNLTVTLGVRNEQIELAGDDRLEGSLNSQDFDETSPKVGFTYDVGQNTKFFVGYSEGFLTPDIGELFTDRGANSDLLPEEAENLEFGIRGGVGYLRYDISVYDTDITNFIVAEELIDDAGLEFLFLTNAGKVNVRGIESVLEYQVHEKLSLGLSHTFAQNEYDIFFNTRSGQDLSGNEISRSPEHHINLRAAWFPFEGFAAELEYDDYSGYYTSDDNAADPLGKFDRDERINLRFSYDIGPWQVWLHGLNLTDTVEDRIGFSRGARTFRVIDGRNVYAGIAYSF